MISPFSPYAPAEHNERQVSLRALRNRQDLFQQEGILNLILDAIDKITVITAQGFMVALAGEEAGQDWDVISGMYWQLVTCYDYSSPLVLLFTLVLLVFLFLSL